MSNKSVIIKEPYKIIVEDRPIPEIEDDEDVIVKVDVSALCGSDLHVYRGHPRQPKYDFSMGHELVGTVKKVGKNITKFKEGDRVVAPFTLSCGKCFFCERGWTGRCEKSQLFGTSVLPGGQAEWARIPLADSSLFHIPTSLKAENAILMCDIFPTGWFCAKNAYELLGDKERHGATAAVIGCGPVGLCGISSAVERFAKVFAIDSVPERLEQAKAHGAIPVKLDDKTIDTIKSMTDGRGPDSILEIVGAPDALQLGIDLVRMGGVVSSVGLHTHEVKLSGLQIYGKNIKFQFGRCPVSAIFDDALATLVSVASKSNVFDSFIQKRVSLDDAPEYYALFNDRKVGKTVFVSQ